MKEDKSGCGCSCDSCDSCPSANAKPVSCDCGKEDCTCDALGCDCGKEDCTCGMADGILTFTDEEGKDVEFQVLDTIAVDDKEYLIVLPLDEENLTEEEKGVVILEIKEEDGEEVYDTVVDDKIGTKVFDLFQKQYEDEEK